MTTTELPALLTRSEAAKVLRVHPSTLSRWAAAGVGPRCIWLSHGTPRYRLADLLSFIAAA